MSHGSCVWNVQVFLTPSHLAIVMEYAAGGELFDFLARRRFLTENEARFFFQQLICGLAHCHAEVRAKYLSATSCVVHKALQTA